MENSLRKLLTRIPEEHWRQPTRAVYAPLRQAAFELQESCLQVLLANGVNRRSLPGGRGVAPAVFALLEPAMRLSEYRVYADFGADDPETLRPFEDFYGQGAPWYLADAHPVLRSAAHLPRCTPSNLILAAGALRCLLHAQFGREVDGMVTSFSARSGGSGYYRRESLFRVEPPDWPPEECYGFTYTAGTLLPVRHYPFDSTSLKL